MERIGRAAAETKVLDLEGRERPLGSLWAERDVVLVFVRHFGCREHAMQLHRARDAIRALGAELIVVGNAVPFFARAFREDLAITTPIYVDPSMASYRVLAARGGFPETLLSGGILKLALRAVHHGFVTGPGAARPWQLGGVLVVRQGGAILYRHPCRGDADGDDLEVDEVLAALAPGAPRSVLPVQTRSPDRCSG